MKALYQHASGAATQDIEYMRGGLKLWNQKDTQPAAVAQRGTYTVRQRFPVSNIFLDETKASPEDSFRASVDLWIFAIEQFRRINISEVCGSQFFTKQCF